MYDVIVIGAGPAGLTAGIYAAKQQLKTLVITEAVPQISQFDTGFEGLEFIISTFKQLMSEQHSFLELKKETRIVRMEKNIVSFNLEDQKGALHYTRAVIIATGALAESGEGCSEFDTLTDKNVQNKIKVDTDMRTNIPGIFAAGHVIDSLPKDMFVASAEGAKASVAAHLYLNNLAR